MVSALFLGLNHGVTISILPTQVMVLFSGVYSSICLGINLLVQQLRQGLVFACFVYL
jgi:hypothetical protein